LNHTEISRPARILPVIVFSQFAGTSLWFAGNAILIDLQNHWHFSHNAIGSITSSVQLGFIIGTLCFAFFAISDKYSPRKIFFLCSIFGAITNFLIYATTGGLYLLLSLRFLTGFSLAGIYPIGMKIASGWYQKTLGKAIGYLVGALVLGTAFPHLLKSIGGSLPWEMVVLAVSAIAVSGGVLMFVLVPDGPHIVKGTAFDPKALILVFKSRDFRSAAFGYFGHMWELYAFWAFVPFILTAYATRMAVHLNISFWSFSVIAAGSIGCIVGGIVAVKYGSTKVAFTQLLLSGICCVLSPFLFYTPPVIFIGFLIFWGIVVVGDSPQYSALTAWAAPKELVGTGLTIVNSIGFAITIVSIQFVNELTSAVNQNSIFLALAVGPVFGLLALKPLLRSFR